MRLNLSVGWWDWDESVCLCVYPSVRADGQEWAGPSCWWHKAVAVQSARCKIAALWPSQRLTKAGGWWLGRECGDTAVSRAYTSRLNMGPPHICSSLAPASARSRDNGGPRQTPLLQSFSKEFLFSLNLKYFIRLPSPAPVLSLPFWAASTGPLLFTPLCSGNALKTTKDCFLKLFGTCCCSKTSSDSK